MLLDQAENALLPLIIATSGWTDEAVEFYAGQLMKLPNADWLAEACETVSTTWRSTRRPPLAEITDTYKAISRRAALATPMPPLDSGSYPTFPEGRQLAASGYADECKRQGREPNWSMFNSLLGADGF